MSVRTYLPSAQFITLVGALALSGGLVVAAQYITKTPPSSITTTTTPSPISDDWQKQLDAIQASSGVNLPAAPDPQTVATLTDSVQTSNLTDSVAKTLLIKLTDAKAKGLGDDIPTQDQLIAEAAASATVPTQPAYTLNDLVTSKPSTEAFRAYGNNMVRVIVQYPQANALATLQAFDYAVNSNNSKQAAVLALTTAKNTYAALARSLIQIPVPSTLAPLHLQVVNDFAQMAASIEDMRAVNSDPLRGLKGLQSFSAHIDEVTRVLTTIAGSFNKNGILFTKDEPGSAWSAFLVSS